MTFTMINESFVCENCKIDVPPHPTGSARNHCPACLCSKHLDSEDPGDRLSDCMGIMPPIGVDHKKNKGIMLRHKCQKCDKEMLNKLAPDDDFLTFQKTLTRSI